ASSRRRSAGGVRAERVGTCAAETGEPRTRAESADTLVAVSACARRPCSAFTTPFIDHTVIKYSESETAQVAGRCFAASTGAALAQRIRRALHAAGELVGGACRRDELEPEQRVGLFVREGAPAVVRGPQGRPDAVVAARPGHLHGHPDQ